MLNSLVPSIVMPGVLILKGARLYNIKSLFIRFLVNCNLQYSQIKINNSKSYS